MSMARRFLVVLSLVAAGCGPVPSASDASGSTAAQPSASAAVPAAVASGVPYAPAIDPANFVEIVDNPYLPLVPGTQWTYEGSGDAEGEVDTVTVLEETRVVM